jgi:hypothetical protein
VGEMKVSLNSYSSYSLIDHELIGQQVFYFQGLSLETAGLS